jgi:hypothetical protein
MAKLTKAEQKTLAEAKAAIGRLYNTLSTGDNRYGEYGRNCRDAIARQEETIRRLETKCKG